MIPMSKKKIMVAMSGGVDSSVAALLLREQGHRVVGVHFRQTNSGKGCCGDPGLSDARRVTQQLGIYFYLLKCLPEFKREVIDYFCRTYLAGETPNPCILCNGRIRFPLLLKLAASLDFDYIATGHYARVGFDSQTNHHFITRSADDHKDQSYFLVGLKERWLDRIIWPLGELSKSEVREIARNAGLEVSEKPDSQDICFVPRKKYAEFLRDARPDCYAPGPIRDRRGRILGTHSGLPFYTVGQRNGLRISSSQPLYVLELEPKSNTIYVGRKEELYRARLTVRECNWIGKPPGSGGFRAGIKVRFRHPEVPGSLRVTSQNRLEVVFDRPQRAIAPGQFAAFYQGDRLLGGGIIDQSFA